MNMKMKEEDVRNRKGFIGWFCFILIFATCVGISSEGIASELRSSCFSYSVIYEQKVGSHSKTGYMEWTNYACTPKKLYLTYTYTEAVPVNDFTKLWHYIEYSSNPGLGPIVFKEDASKSESHVYQYPAEGNGGATQTGVTGQFSFTKKVTDPITYSFCKDEENYYNNYYAPDPWEGGTYGPPYNCMVSAGILSISAELTESGWQPNTAYLGQLNAFPFDGVSVESITPTVKSYEFKAGGMNVDYSNAYEFTGYIETNFGVGEVSVTHALSNEYPIHANALADMEANGWGTGGDAHLAVGGWVAGTGGLMSVDVAKLRVSVRISTEKDKHYEISWEEVEDLPGCSVKVEAKSTSLEGDDTTQVLEIASLSPPSTPGRRYVNNVRVVETCCGCPDPSESSPGAGSEEVGSIKFRLNMGNALQGKSAGSIQLWEISPSLGLATPGKLRYTAPRPEIDVVSAADVLRQIKAPQALADVVTINAFKYDIRFYVPADVGAKVDGLYAILGDPYVTWTVENPDASTNVFHRLRITETRGANSRVVEYLWNNVTQGWKLSKNGKVEEVAKVWNEADSNWIEYHTISDNNGNLVSKRRDTYHVFTWGRELIESVIDPDGAALATTYTYSGPGMKRQISNWDGSWQIFEYDGSARVTKTYSTFLNQGPTTNASLCRVTENSYSPLEGTDDDGTVSPDSVRRTVQKLLGEEIARSYSIFMTNETRSIQCVTPGAAWDAENNLVSITKTYVDGDFEGKTKSVSHANGTLTLYEYSYDVSTNKLTIIYSGAPGVEGTNIVDGVKTVTLTGINGQMLAVTNIDIASGIVIGREIYSNFDEFNRPQRVSFLDGTFTEKLYSCCVIESEKDRNGIETVYGYDALKRRVSTTRSGVTMIQVLDALGRATKTIQQGTNGTQIVISQSAYDLAGRLVNSLDALENETTYAVTINGSGEKVLTTIYADTATRIETYYKDGTVKTVGGTSEHGIRNEHGLETDGGVSRMFSKQIRLLTNGVDSGEWVKTYTDTVGNSYKTLYPDGATNVTYFNNKGQAWKQVGADGVVSLSQYNTKGKLEYTVLDVDRDDTIDFSGNDRITRMLSYPTNAHGVDVVRSETWQWQTLGANTPVLLSTSDRSVETKESWQFAFGLTNYSIHVCVTNLVVCYSTNVAPDGSYTVSMSQYGLPLSSTRYASNGVQLAQQSIGYDEFNRTITITDVRTGTITNTLDALGRTLTRTTPAPAPGQNPQTTQTDYDNRGRLWRVIEPDGGVVVTTYHPTGELKRKVGNRTYPVDYTYDYSGRMRTQKTWQDFNNNSGAAVTTWNYDSQRGFMTSKRYADNKGPDYEYTLTGKLAKRTWARGVETDYTYDDAGDLMGVNYSDSTPDVIYTYDRVGRKVTVAQGSQDAVTLHYTAAGQLAAEQHTSGLLSGITVTNAYDGLLRRTHLTVLTNGGTVYQALYGYDAASRMLTVSDGTNNATYGYVTNSSMVAEIAFKQNSTLRMTTIKQYDLLNRLTNISSTTASFTNSFAYLYNDANQRTKVTREDGSYWNYGYDDLGQVTSGKRYWADNTPVAGQQYEYKFDEIGNRKETRSGGDEFGGSLRRSTYTVNSLNQYTNRTLPGGADVVGTANASAKVTVNNQPTYRKGEYFRAEVRLNNQGQAVYTGITNRAVLNDGGNPDIVTTNSGKLFLPQTPEEFEHDDDGNLTDDGRWTYTWDGENRLIQMEAKSGAVSAGTAKQKLEFTYDDQWRRIQKKVSDWNGSSYTPMSTNRFVYDGWNLVTTLTSTILYQSFLWGKDISGSERGAGGIGGLLAVQDTVTSTVNFTALDGSGNILALISAASGMQSGRYEYGPFGEVIGKYGTLAEGNVFQFSSKHKDIESGLLYYGYRYYDPSTGRWLSRDPIGENGGENVSAFLNNNPINYSDALGLAALEYRSEGRFFTDGQWLGYTSDGKASGVESDSNAWFWHQAVQQNCPGGLCNTGGDLKEKSSFVLASVKNKSKCPQKVTCDCTVDYALVTFAFRRMGGGTVHGHVLEKPIAAEFLPSQIDDGKGPGYWVAAGVGSVNERKTFTLALNESRQLYYSFIATAQGPQRGAGFYESMSGNCTCTSRSFDCPDKK
jgi:RHS repeat-associated protein